MKHNVPIQSLIDHIKTAIDVDPWAKEMVEDLLKEQEAVEPKIYPETRYSGPLVACGECRRELTDGRPRFCPYCGRQIRWED